MKCILFKSVFFSFFLFLNQGLFYSHLKSEEIKEGDLSLKALRLKDVEGMGKANRNEVLYQRKSEEALDTEAKVLFQGHPFSTPAELNEKTKDKKTKEEISRYVRKILKTNEYNQPKER